jgi:hypothetical protein
MKGHQQKANRLSVKCISKSCFSCQECCFPFKIKDALLPARMAGSRGKTDDKWRIELDLHVSSPRAENDEKLRTSFLANEPIARGTLYRDVRGVFVVLVFVLEVRKLEKIENSTY